MDTDLRELIESNRALQNQISRKEPKPKAEFSKIMMIFASVLCGGTWIVAVVAYFLGLDFPTDLAGFALAFYGAVSVAYMAKSGYENRAKIECGRGDGL